ncbi:hypothetical protein D3C73_960350 [compost metagenome]
MVKDSDLLGSNGKVVWLIAVAVEFRLIVDEMEVVVFGDRFEVSMRRSVRMPLMILPLASTP